MNIGIGFSLRRSQQAIMSIIAPREPDDVWTWDNSEVMLWDDGNDVTLEAE